MGYSIIDVSTGQPFNESIEGAKQLNWGKTKRVFDVWNGGLAITHEDVLTAMDDPLYTGVAPGKGTVSAFSSAVLFRRLAALWVRTSHIGIINANTTHEEALDMMPFEIIWRRYNVTWNSWEVRNPGQVPENAKFDEIIYEACLKWSVIDKDEPDEKKRVVNDPFLVLDDNFVPQLRPDGMPRLMHPKKAHTEIDYETVIHPNKKNEVPLRDIQGAMDEFKMYARETRQMAEKSQAGTFDTYKKIGRVNVDGKLEDGPNKDSRILTLGDELELDALRNLAPIEVEIDGIVHRFEAETLGTDLDELLDWRTEDITSIPKSRHSGKQGYRNEVKKFTELQWEARKTANNEAAAKITNTIYIPVAQALSDRFGQEVGYILKKI